MVYANRTLFTRFPSTSPKGVVFNEKNTEIGIKGSIYLDTWHPVYPTEIHSYLEVEGDLNDGFFENVDILNENGNIINKNSSNAWNPFQNKLIDLSKLNKILANAV